LTTVGYTEKSIAAATDGGLSCLRSSGPGRQQLLHSDFQENIKFRENTISGTFANIPIVVIIALCNNTPFMVMARGLSKHANGRCEFEDPQNAVDLLLQTGDACMFRADLLHAGAGFKHLQNGDSNYRMHVFISSEDNSIQNPRNSFKVAQILPSRLPRAAARESNLKVQLTNYKKRYRD